MNSVPTGRIWQLDLFRGLCLAIMAIDHFGGPITRITRETVGFVSVAEGFVFISGAVAGLVYGRLSLQRPQFLFRKTFRRAALIYFSHLATILALLLLARLAPGIGRELHARAHLLPDSPPRVVLWSVLLLHQPMLLDILPMYVLFLLAVPFVLQRFVRGRMRLLVAASFLIWLAAQTGLRERLLNGIRFYLGARFASGMFDVLAWQFLFLLGLAVGFSRLTGGNSALEKLRDRRLVVVAIVLSVLLFLFRHSPTGGAVLHSSPLASRALLGPLRLFNFLLLAHILWQTSGRLRRVRLLRWLAFLGRHSLQVFVYHTVVMYLILPLRPAIERWGGTVDALLSLAFAASLTLPAWGHQSWQRRRRRKEAAVQRPLAVAEKEQGWK